MTVREQKQDLKPPRRRYEKGPDGIWRIQFESIAELIEQGMSQDTGLVRYNVDHVRDRINTMRFYQEYYNKHTKESMLEAITCPPNMLVTEVSDLKDRIEGAYEAPIGRVRKVRRGLDMGDELDVDAWLQRDPNGWSEPRHCRVNRPIVRIAINITVASSQMPSALLYRGAATVALADLLTDLGYSVELICFAAETRKLQHTRDGKFLTIVPIKRSTDPLDIASAAFVLSEIAFYRSVMLNAVALGLHGPIHYNHGMCCTLYPEVAREFDIVVDWDIRSEVEAVAMLKKYVHNVTTRSPS